MSQMNILFIATSDPMTIRIVEITPKTIYNEVIESI